MSVDKLNQVHGRYIKTSNGFKSAWTFHQFIQGLRKVFIEEGPASYPADFQSVYNDLKEVSKNLSEHTLQKAVEQLDEVEEGLRPLIEALLVADEQVSPGLLRQFFQRVKNYDDNILSQLVKFYLYFRDGDDWNWDRLDKADYLSTKVCEEYQDARDAFIPRDRTHVRETAEGFWAALGSAPVPEIEVADVVGEIAKTRQEIGLVESIDDLHDRDLVRRFRDFKHRLGDKFFQPKILGEIVETNLAFKNHVQQLYLRDEQRIVAEYQQVFELERETPPSDLELREELAEFRAAVEHFENRLQGGKDVRLEHLAKLRGRVRSLLPRLQPDAPAEPDPLPAPPEVREFLAEQAAAEPSTPAVALEDEAGDQHYNAVVSVLDDTNSAIEPRKVVLQPEVFGLGIDAREVVAYRRLFSRKGGDRRLEDIVLRGAGLRVRIKNEVEEIRGIFDDTAVSTDTPMFAQVQTTLRRADLTLRRLGHLVEQSLLAGDAAEARDLLRLKMKMMREYAGLWILVYKD